jgi:hypothetical protein
MRGMTKPSLEAVLSFSTLGLFGLLLGARLIWKTVRRINHRDDPRYGKRPPDPP